MTKSGGVAVALVTHNAEQWIEGLAQSILTQSQPVDAIVVVDDYSTDGTVDSLNRAFGKRVVVHAASTKAHRAVDRIADNFTQAVMACRSSEIVILGDHDDLWLPDRVARQVDLISCTSGSQLLMVASDGNLIDENGHILEGSLRSNFHIPEGMNGEAREVLRTTLTHLVATGGASAIRPSAFPNLNVPRGWLHDRWWSLVAAARGGLVLDGEAVINYRIHASQQEGLRRGGHGAGIFARGIAVGPLTVLRKLSDYHAKLQPLAEPSLRNELGLWRMARTFTDVGYRRP